MSLYTNNHPETTIHGLGFKNKETAEKSLKILDKNVKKKVITKIRMMQTVNTLLNRAKFHPHQTKGMRDAIKIYKKWMKDYKTDKE